MADDPNDSTGDDDASKDKTADTGPATAGQRQAAKNDGADDGPRFTQADLDRVVRERLIRDREALTKKYGNLEELHKRAASAMTEQERAVAEAEQRGATAAAAKTATRLAKAELKAAAAGHVDPKALAGFLEYADMSKFVSDDGEPDDKAIAAAVKQLSGTSRAPDFDGGARTTAGRPTDMNQLIRQKAGMG